MCGPRAAHEPFEGHDRPLFQLVEPDELGLTIAGELRTVVDVIGSTTKGEPFEAQDEIRGIVLDRGFVILGKRERLTCYVRREQLGSVALVGVQAQVRGSLFRPLTGRPFVLAEEIELGASPEEEEE